MNWLQKKGLRALGGGVIIAHTVLTAQKRELGEDGLYHDTDVRRVVKDKVVTDDFVELIVDTLVANDDGIKDFKYHHSGTGVGAEAAADSGLGTPELDARTVGTQAENTSKVYQSVATETFDGVAAITEHVLFNTAGAGGPPVTGGVGMDRTKFAAINVVDTNQIQWTFEITFASGG